tara:strand:+ start:11941 stop:12144 length:204 start_codon:yes stop_codon:yes gene_type:complete
MNKEEARYLIGGVLSESVYKNPNQNAVKEKIKEAKEIMEEEYGIPKATLPQIVFHVLKYYIKEHKRD